MANPRFGKGFSFYNSYYSKIRTDVNIIVRYTSLTYGYSYNLFKKNSFNVGLQSGLFLFDATYDKNAVFHSFGLTFIPHLEYRYHFKNFGLGLNTMLPVNIGKYKMPIFGYFPTDVQYDSGFGVNTLLFLNFTFTKKI